MRFTPSGPSIPNDLLDARDAGEVVFLCGAGISIPAGLPDFFSLTVEVAKRLGVQPESTAGLLIETERKSRATSLSSQSRESVSFDRIFTLLVREFGVTQVEREVVAVLARGRRPRIDHHRALLEIARGPDGRQRLITTNFDRLFERAQARLRSYAPPHFPDLARRDGFDGVVHLHGVLPSGKAKQFDEPLGLILSSSDFGRAYLAEGSATRFICDLLDRNIVVLLGYSAEDAPVRYLLEGLNALGRIRERRLYAFAAGEAAEVTADWRERGVTAIAYDPEEQHRHLWDGIHGWAERARNPGAWRQRITVLAATPPQQLKAFERGQVAALCSSVEGAREFASATPPPPAEWLCVFDAACRYRKPGREITYSPTPAPEINPLVEFGLDDDPPRLQDPRDDQRSPGIDILSPLSTDDAVAPESKIVTLRHWITSPLNARLFQIARWMQAVVPSSTTVWWAASRGALHPSLREQISWVVDRNATVLDPLISHAWRLVLEAVRSVPDHTGDGWWAVHSEIQKEGWIARTIREFSSATRPRLTVQYPWAHAPVPPDKAIPLTLSRIGHFEVHYPKLIERTETIPDAALAEVLTVIRTNLELGSALETEVSQVNLRLPTLYPEDRPGEHHYTESEEYYVSFARLFERLATFDPAAARREYSRWDGPGRFFIALRIWALAKHDIVTAAEVGKALRELDRETFWDPDQARELLWTLRARWSGLSQRDRRAVESKILFGRPKYQYESEEDYIERRSSLAAERLIWMRDSGLKLSPKTIARLPELKKANPNWRDSWAKEADASHEGRVGWVKQETDPSPIAKLPLSEVLARCDELAQREFLSFTERDPFRGLVTTAPRRAIAVLVYEARRENYPHRYWSRLLSDWPKTIPSRQTVGLAKALTALPRSVLVQIRYELGRWMTTNFATIDRFDCQGGHHCFDHIVDALEQGGEEALKSGLGKTSVGGAEIPSNRMGVDYAINSPTGDLAQGLINALFARKPKRNERIAKDLRPRLERLLALPGEGGRHALTIIAQQLHGLYVIDRAWCKKILLPYFNPQQEAAEAAWSGFLHASQMPVPALFLELKTYFLAAIAATPRWTAEGLTHLGQVLVLALELQQPRELLISSTEARTALRSASAETRRETLFFLRSRAPQKGAWSKLIVPFFRNVWPRERKLQTAETTRMLLLFLEDLGELFADGVRLVADFLEPVPEVDVFVYQFGSDGEQGSANLTRQFPQEALLVLDKVIGNMRERAPYGLAGILTQIADAAPSLRHDARWQRLERLTMG
jgi:SIR2-like protein